jgi:hypothetical protein
MENETFVLAAAAVFCGNILTVIFVMSLHRLWNVHHRQDAPWLALAGVIVPALAVVTAGLVLRQ